MKTQAQNSTNFKIVDLLMLEEIPPSQAEKIQGGEDVDTNGDGILDSTMTRKVAQSLGYKCIGGQCG